MSNDDLLRLLSEARLRNSSCRITGMLLYKDGYFMQVLEGDEANVLEVFSDVQKDQRHKNVDILRSEFIQHRNFPDWSMGFVNVDDLDTASVPGFTRFLEHDFRSDFFAEDSVEAHAILLTFKGIPLPGIDGGNNHD